MAKHARTNNNQPHHLSPQGGRTTPQGGYVPATPAYQEYKTFTRSSWQHAGSAQGKKKMGAGKKIAIAFVCFFALVAVGIGTYIWQLDKALSVGPEESSDLLSQLTKRTSNEPFYVLVLGSDKREISNSSERSDVTMLVRVDANKKILTLLSIPRDTPVTFEDGHVDRINTAYRDGGAAGAVKAVSGLTGVDISHYAEIRMSEFEALIDDLGGIDIEVPTELLVRDLITREWIKLEPGMQHINGLQAQAIARVRKAYSDGDVSRQNMNRQIVMAIIDNVLSRPIQEIPEAALIVASHIDTDMGTLDIFPLLGKFGTDMNNVTIYSATGPTDGGERADLNNEWICYDNPEGWRLIMEAMDAGKDPSTIDVSEYTIYPESVEEAETGE